MKSYLLLFWLALSLISPNLISLNYALAKKPHKIKITKQWYLATKKKPFTMKFPMANAHVTRFEQGSLKGVFIYHEFQKMNAKKVKRLMKAARVPASQMKSTRTHKGRLYAFKMNDSVIWYSSKGGRVVGTFEKLSKKDFAYLTKRMRRL